MPVITSYSIHYTKLYEWDGGFYEKIGVSFESPNHYLKLTGIENLTRNNFV